MNTQIIICLAVVVVAGADSGRAQATLNIERQGNLHWLHWEAEYVLLSMDSLEGPGALWPNIIYHNGDSRWTEVTSGGSARFEFSTPPEPP